MLPDTILADTTVTGLSVYGLGILFFKASLLILLATSLADQFEFSPAAIRHSIWLIAFLSMACLPLLTALLPALVLVPISLDSPSLSGSPPAVEVITTLSWVDWAAIIYLLVVLVRLIMLLVSLLQIASITSVARHAPAALYRQLRRYTHQRILIKIASGLEGPVTWGYFRPVILLPADYRRWSNDELRMILQHEVSHIQRRDWLLLLTARCVAILYWPVPGIARALRWISLETERACDDKVLLSGNDAASYAGVLVNQARKNRLQASVALGHSSELVQRVRHIVNAYVDRAGIKRTQYLLMAAAILFLLPFAAIQGKIVYAADSGTSLSAVFVSINDQAQSATSGNPLRYEPKPNVVKPVRPYIAHTPRRVALDAGIENAHVTDLAARFNAPVMVAASPQIPNVLFSEGHLLEMRKPVYPRWAQKEGIEGRVVVQFDVGRRGYVIDPRIIDTTSGNVFNRAVLNAIQQFRYAPTLINGEPVRLRDRQEEFRFHLIETSQSRSPIPGNARASPPASSG